MIKEKSTILLFVFGILILGLSQGCNKDKLEPVMSVEECDEQVTYDGKVAEIITNNCSTSGCHDNSGAGGYTFLNYQQVSDNASIILQAIKHESGVVAMPLGQDQLKQDKINDVNCWILQGKKEN